MAKEKYQATKDILKAGELDKQIREIISEETYINNSIKKAFNKDLEVEVAFNLLEETSSEYKETGYEEEDTNPFKKLLDQYSGGGSKDSDTEEDEAEGFFSRDLPPEIFAMMFKPYLKYLGKRKKNLIGKMKKLTVKAVINKELDDAKIKSI